MTPPKGIWQVGGLPGWAALFLVLGASSILFLYQLGGYALVDTDEPIFGINGKGMVQSGDWLTPRYEGRPMHDKPILFYWLVALGFQLFGLNELGARLGSALAGIGGVLATYHLGRTLYNSQVGLISALVLATSLEYVVLARAAVTDMTLTCLITLALLAFYLGYQGKGKRQEAFLWFYALTGLATLTKGPIGVLLPLAIAGIFLLASGERQVWRQMRCGWGVAIFLAVVLPWYLLMSLWYGREFLDTFLVFHNVIRFLQPEHQVGATPFFFLPVLLIGFFPWVVFLPQGIWQLLAGLKGLRKGGELRRSSQAGLFLVIWVGFIFLFFSLSRTKLVTYILPLFPVLAITVGRLWQAYVQEGEGPLRRGLAIAYGLLLPLTAALIATPLVVPKLKATYGPLLSLAMVPLLALGLLVGLSALLFYCYRGNRWPALLSLPAAVILFVVLVVTFLMPSLEPYISTRALSLQARSRLRPGEPLGVFRFNKPSIHFYFGQEIIPLEQDHELGSFLTAQQQRPVLLLMRQRDYERLLGQRPATGGGDALAARTTLVARQGGAVLLSNQPRQRMQGQ